MQILVREVQLVELPVLSQDLVSVVALGPMRWELLGVLWLVLSSVQLWSRVILRNRAWSMLLQPQMEIY